MEEIQQIQRPGFWSSRAKEIENKEIENKQQQRAVASLGKYLSEQRKDKGVSYTDVGAALGLSGKIIYRLEKGNNKCLPSSDRMKKLAKYYNISIYDILAKSGYSSAELTAYRAQAIFSNVPLEDHCQEDVSRLNVVAEKARNDQTQAPRTNKDIDKLLQHVGKTLSETRPSLAASISNCQIRSITQNEFKIETPENQYLSNIVKKNLHFLKNIMEEFLKHKITLHLITSNSNLGEIPKKDTVHTAHKLDVNEEPLYAIEAKLYMKQNLIITGTFLDWDGSEFTSRESINSAFMKALSLELNQYLKLCAVTIKVLESGHPIEEELNTLNIAISEISAVHHEVNTLRSEREV